MNEKFKEYVSYIKSQHTEIDTKSLIEQKKQFTIWKLAGYLALASILLFVGSIAVIPTFAQNMAEIPFLREFVLLFQPSPSMKESFEYQYYQLIEQSVIVDGVEVKVEAIMVDEYETSVFYRVFNLDKNEYPRYELDIEALSQGEYYWSISGVMTLEEAKDGGLGEFRFGYLDPHLDDEIKITIVLTNGETTRKFRFEIPVDVSKIGKTKEFSLSQVLEITHEKLKNHILMISLDKIRVTPSKATLVVPWNEDMEYDVRKVHYAFIDDNGNESEEVSNGISGYGLPNRTQQFMVESKYFKLDQYRRIKIKGFEVIPKTQYGVWYDITSKTFHNLTDNYYDVELQITGREVELSYRLHEEIGTLANRLEVDSDSIDGHVTSSVNFHSEDKTYQSRFTLKGGVDVISFTNYDALYIPYEKIIELR